MPIATTSRSTIALITLLFIVRKVNERLFKVIHYSTQDYAIKIWVLQPVAMVALHIHIKIFARCAMENFVFCRYSLPAGQMTNKTCSIERSEHKPAAERRKSGRISGPETDEA